MLLYLLSAVAVLLIFLAGAWCGYCFRDLQHRFDRDFT